jgi:hypothetical protein
LRSGASAGVPVTVHSTTPACGAAMKRAEGVGTMTEPPDDRDRLDRQIDDLELHTETVQDLTDAEAEDVKGGGLLLNYTTACATNGCARGTFGCAVDTGYCGIQPKVEPTYGCQTI